MILVIGRWEDAPRSVRVTVGAFVLVLAYGTVVHLLQLVASGFNPHPALPDWLRAYFTALTVLDPPPPFYSRVVVAVAWSWP